MASGEGPVSTCNQGHWVRFLLFGKKGVGIGVLVFWGKLIGPFTNLSLQDCLDYFAGRVCLPVHSNMVLGSLLLWKSVEKSARGFWQTAFLFLENLGVN